MRTLIIILFISIPFVLKSQPLRHSRAYVGAALQDGRPGGSLVLSYGVSQYLGVGAGIDLLSYKLDGQSGSKFFAPFYVDLRIKYPVNKIEPFIMGQFGKPAYENEIKGYRDEVFEPIDVKLTGKYFVGCGGGIAIKQSRRLGVFVSVAYRKYYFNHDPDHFDINGRVYTFDAFNKGTAIVTAGLVF